MRPDGTGVSKLSGNGNIKRRGGRSDEMEQGGATAFCDGIYSGKMCSEDIRAAGKRFLN